MRRLAIYLVIVAIAVTVADVYIIPDYLKLSRVGWEWIFSSKSLHHYIVMAFGAVVFGLIPGIAILCGGSAWTIFKHLGDISNKNRNG